MQEKYSVPSGSRSTQTLNIEVHGGTSICPIHLPSAIGRKDPGGSQDTSDLGGWLPPGPPAVAHLCTGEVGKVQVRVPSGKVLYFGHGGVG